MCYILLLLESETKMEFYYFQIVRTVGDIITYYRNFSFPYKQSVVVQSGYEEVKFVTFSP